MLDVFFFLTCSLPNFKKQGLPCFHVCYCNLKGKFPDQNHLGGGRVRIPHNSGVRGVLSGKSGQQALNWSTTPHQQSRAEGKRAHVSSVLSQVSLHLGSLGWSQTRLAPFRLGLPTLVKAIKTTPYR